MGTFIVIVAINFYMVATSFRTARINGTFIIIITISNSIGTTDSRITTIISTLIIIITISYSVGATSLMIARIISTGVMIIATDGVFRASSFRIAAASRASILETDNWHKGTTNFCITVVIMTFVISLTSVRDISVNASFFRNTAVFSTGIEIFTVYHDINASV
jgi:hypothetical protein